MLDGDRARIELAYSLLLSLPGTPVLFYGEEIGMGENLDVAGRSAVRTPMQWSDEPGAGFSTAAEEGFPRPLPTGEFGPAAVNVATQRTDPDSLLNWFERMIRRRRDTTELALGQPVAILTAPVALYAQRCTWQDSSVVTVHNLGSDPVEVAVPLGEDGDEEVLGADDLLEPAWVTAEDGHLSLKLDGYGYRWLRIRRATDRRTP